MADSTLQITPGAGGVDAGATWSFYQTLQGMTYRGFINHVKNGFDGCRILGASSETDPHDIWVH